jgi:hypothetical protein
MERNLNFELSIRIVMGNQNSIYLKALLKIATVKLILDFQRHLSNANYGVSLSMQSNKPGIIQYSMLQKKV